MSNRIQVDVEGFSDLVKKIELLRSDKQKKTEITALLRQIASSTVSSAKRTAPKSTKKHTARGKSITPGNLRKSIGTIVGKKGNARVNPTVYAGPRAKNNNDGWYGHMVEAGHYVYRNSSNRAKGKSVLARVTNKRQGNRVGFVRGAFYMKQAYDQTKGKVTAESETKVARYIQRRIDRLSR